MLWYISQPLHARGLQFHVGVQAPGDGLVDQCLPLLSQEGDEPLLAGDIPLDLRVGVVEEPDDGGLFVEGWVRTSLLVCPRSAKTWYSHVS